MMILSSYNVRSFALLTILSFVIIVTIQPKYIVIAFKPTTPSESLPNVGAARPQSPTQSTTGISANDSSTSESKIGNATTQEQGIQSIGTSSILTYENPVHGIKINYPSNWTVTTGNGTTSGLTDVALFSSPEYDDYATVNFYVENLTVSGSSHNLKGYMDSYLAMYNESLKEFPNFTLNSSNLAETIGGMPAYSMIGKFDEPTRGTLNLIDTGTLRGNLAYSFMILISPNKYVEYLPIVEAIVDSFEINK